MIDTTPGDLIDILKRLPPEDRAELDALLTAGLPLWLPQVGPQTRAYESPADIVFYGGQAGGGKGLALDTQLPTPTGFVSMRDVAVGDELFDEKGAVCRVVGVSDVSHRPCYRLTFDDGSKVVADDVHRWVTLDARDLAYITANDPGRRARRRENRPSRSTGNKSAAFVASLSARNSARAAAKEFAAPSGTMRSTAEINASLRTASGRANHAIPVAGALQCAEAVLPVPPYTMGAWLGDGSSRNGQITGEDDEVFDRIEADGFVVRNYEWDRLAHNVLGLKAKLRQCGVLNNKHIPDEYLRASIEQRMELLRGLMDTDGHAAIDGGCEYDGVNETLVRGVFDLVRSLGIKATIHQGIAKLDGNSVGPKWRVKFTTSAAVFGLSRKISRLKPSTRATQSRRYLVACEQVDSVPTKCISVDSPTHQYLATAACIPTHNTDLLLGLALTAQRHSILFRRQSVQLVGIEERMTTILGTRVGYNSQTGVWRLPGGRVLELGSTKEPGDWMKYQGRAHDAKLFDEICHFTELQFRSLIGWMRTDDPTIRQRVVCAGNPPTDPEGEWVVRFWAPWLDPQHPNPAKDGELRWFVTDENGKDKEVPGPEPVLVDGDMMVPKSRTFIRSSVDDNLYLQTTGYKATLQALPEPLRSQMLRGDFLAGRSDPVWQLIPTEWVKAAQARWVRRDVKGTMTAIGFDVSRGGLDKTTAARRHGQWFDELVQVPGVVTDDGPKAAAFIVPLVRNGACICVDAIGIGSSALDFVVGLNLLVLPVVGSESSPGISVAGNLRFKNKRAEMYWRLREALDPTAPEPIYLPPDQELLTDLTAVRYKVVQMGMCAGIQIRDKDEIREAIGRSPDKGDAVAMTFVSGIPAPGSMRKRSGRRDDPDWR